MLRSAFSMIELVFVIVILGILAAVAIPNFSGLQDDALISNEKTTIGLVRQGVISLYGQRLIRGKDFSVTYTTSDGTDRSALVNFTSRHYPVSLDVEDNTIASSDNTFTSATTTGDNKSLALIIDSDSLGEWNRSGQATASDKIAYSGPASNIVIDQNAILHTGSYWQYDNTNGKLSMK